MQVLASSPTAMTWELKRKSFVEFLLDCNFRFRMSPLNIGPIRGVNFYDQTAILLLMILNWLVS